MADPKLRPQEAGLEAGGARKRKDGAWEWGRGRHLSSHLNRWTEDQPVSSRSTGSHTSQDFMRAADSVMPRTDAPLCLSSGSAPL